MKKTGLGIVLLVLAGLILFQNYLPQMNFPIWSLIWMGGVGFLFLIFLVKKRLVESFIFGTWLFILLNNQFKWLNIGMWSIILAATLLCAGLSLIFKPNTGSHRLSQQIEREVTEKISSELTNHLDEEVLEGTIATEIGKSLSDWSINRSGQEETHVEPGQDWPHLEENEKQSGRFSAGSSSVFGSSNRYVQDDAFVEDCAEVAFGVANVYLDNAVMLNDQAVFHVDAAMSTINLYLPMSWRVGVQVDSVLSSVNNYTSPSGQKILQIDGDLVFSTLNIYSV